MLKLPDNVSTLEGALMEPMPSDACGNPVRHQGRIEGRSHRSRFIGLVTMLAIKSMGVRDHCCGHRKEQTERTGAGIEIVDASACDPVQRVLELTGGGAEYVFETAGTETTIFQTGKMVRRGGTITLIGYTSDGTAKMNVNWIIDNEVTIKTVFRYRNIYPTIIEAVSKGMIPLRK